MDFWKKLWNLRSLGIAPYVIYALLSVAILGFSFERGYILALDSSLSFHYSAPGHLYGLNEWATSVFGASMAAAPFAAFQHVLGGLFPGWLPEKLFLLFVFFLAGVGIHHLVPGKSEVRFFSGLLYMINPFTYVRFLAGQWGVLWAYAATPFAVKAFIDLLEKGGARNAVKVAVLATLVGMLQLHGFFLLFLVFAVMLSVHSFKNRRQPHRIAATVKDLAISGALFLALNLYWLIPYLTAGSSIIGQIGPADMVTFAPLGDLNFGAVIDVAAMYGFWRGGYIYAKDILQFWWVLFAVILFLAIYGLLSAVGTRSHPGPAGDRVRDRDSAAQGDAPQHRWVAPSMGITWFAALVLAVGHSSSLTKPGFEWLWQHVPYFSGFRDSQKFVALICLAYAYLGGFGLNAVLAEIKSLRKTTARIAVPVVAIIALSVPPAYSFTMFGFYDQLGVTDYPKEWYEVNEILNRDNSDFNVLFLPWHMYMDFGWLPNMNKRLANPAHEFFDKPVIAGDNIETPGTYSQSTNPISDYVQFLLSHRDSVSNLGELLAPLDVKYVILVEEADYELYDFLNRQDDLNITAHRPGITLYENQHQTARSYSVDSVINVTSLDEYIDLSKTQDVMQHLYVFGKGASEGVTPETEVIPATAANPVKYRVGGTSRKYTVFTVPQNVNTEHWQYDGSQPIFRNLGFMPVFSSKQDGGTLVYTRFYGVYLPSYIGSAAMLIVMVGLFFWRRKPRGHPT